MSTEPCTGCKQDFDECCMKPATGSPRSPAAVTDELRGMLDDAGKDGDGGELAAHVLDELKHYFSTEALLSALTDRADTDTAALVRNVSTADVCKEVRHRIVSQHSPEPNAAETASQILGEHVTLSEGQLKAQFKESKLSVSDVFPDEIKKIEQRAEAVDDLLRMAAALAFDMDFSRLADLRHWLRMHGVHGHSAEQVAAASVSEVLL